VEVATNKPWTAVSIRIPTATLGGQTQAGGIQSIIDAIEF